MISSVFLQVEYLGGDLLHNFCHVFFFFLKLQTAIGFWLSEHLKTLLNPDLFQTKYFIFWLLIKEKENVYLHDTWCLI